jgi:hypothetical protein
VWFLAKKLWENASLLSAQTIILKDVLLLELLNLRDRAELEQHPLGTELIPSVTFWESRHVPTVNVLMYSNKKLTPASATLATNSVRMAKTVLISMNVW